MAEATSTEAPKQATKAEGLTYTSVPEKVRRFSQLKDAQERSAALKRKQSEGKGNIDIAREVASGDSGRKVSDRDLDRAEATFGAGKAKVNENGQVEPPSADNKDAKENYDRGKKAIDLVRDYKKFFDIRTDVDNGLKSADLMSKYGNGWNAEYNQIRARVADAVLSSDAASLLPDEVLSLTDVGAKREIVQEFLLKDPKLRNAYEGKVAEALDSVSRLGQSEKPPELIEAEVAHQTAESNHSKNTETLFQRATQDRVNLSENEKSEIRTYLDNGSQEDAVRRMLEIANQGGRYPHAELFDELEKLTPNAIKDLQSEFLSVPPKPERGEDRFAGIRNQKGEEYASAMERRSQILNAIKGSEFEQREYTSFKEGIKQSIQQAIVSGEPLKTASQKLQAEQAKWNEKNRGQEAPRLAQEAEIIRQLENALSQSVGEVMTSRYEELDEALKQESEENQKKAEEEGKKQVAVGLKLLREDGDIHWVNLDKDTRKKTANRTGLKEDALFVTYTNKSEGFTRLRLRALRNMVPFETLDADGNEVPFDWEHADLTKLTAEQKKLLTDVTLADNGNYEKRFFSDFFSSRKLVDRYGGQLKLKDHEYALLDEKYGDVIDQAIGNSKETQQAIKSLEARGIKPKSKGALLALLILMGAIGLGGKKLLVG